MRVLSYIFITILNFWVNYKVDCLVCKSLVRGSVGTHLKVKGFLITHLRPAFQTRISCGTRFTPAYFYKFPYLLNSNSDASINDEMFVQKHRDVTALDSSWSCEDVLSIVRQSFLTNTLLNQFQKIKQGLKFDMTFNNCFGINPDITDGRKDNFQKSSYSEVDESNLIDEQRNINNARGKYQIQESFTKNNPERSRIEGTSLNSQSEDIENENSEFDVIVIGAGHAGVEAAVAASRICPRVCIVSNQGEDGLGLLSCNPSVGGSGKTHLVCEVDACGGLIGRAADLSALHWRTLNRSRGPAAWAERVQVDRQMYSRAIKKYIGYFYPRIKIVKGTAERFLIDNEYQKFPIQTRILSESETQIPFASKKKVKGLQLVDGTEIYCRALVVATGTFLSGSVAIGHERVDGGRVMSCSGVRIDKSNLFNNRKLKRIDGVEKINTAKSLKEKNNTSNITLDQQFSCAEVASEGLSASLRSLDLPMMAFKTGTPPRLCGKSVDWDHVEAQPSEKHPRPFSAGHCPLWLCERRKRLISEDEDLWMSCFQTKTEARTHALVRKYLHTLPTHRGKGGLGNGPRYCPSIATKIRQFPSRLAHVIWLEPEDSSFFEVYPSGLSGAFPAEVQHEIVQSIPGLQNAQITRLAYDVEYDVVNPKAIHQTMQARDICGLFFAGQVVGTTGYEEAAALGLLAGWNAGLVARAEDIRLKQMCLNSSERENIFFSPDGKEAPSVDADEQLKADEEKYEARFEGDNGKIVNESFGAHPKCMVLDSKNSMIGLLAELLCARGVEEPFRMFSARAEARLRVRTDNASSRMVGEILRGKLLSRNSSSIQRAVKTANSVRRIANLFKGFVLSAYGWISLIDRAFGAQSGNENVDGVDIHQRMPNVENILGILTQCGSSSVECLWVKEQIRFWRLAMSENPGKRWTAAQLVCISPQIRSNTPVGMAGKKNIHDDMCDITNEGAGESGSGSSSIGEQFGGVKYAQFWGYTNEAFLNRREVLTLELLTQLLMLHFQDIYKSKTGRDDADKKGKGSLNTKSMEEVDYLYAQAQKAKEAINILQALLNKKKGYLAAATTSYADIRYIFYTDREEQENSGAFARMRLLPLDKRYTREEFPFLSLEEVEKLEENRPQSLQDATALGILRPSSLLQLSKQIRRRKFKT